MSKQETTLPEWWSERGEREEAGSMVAHLRSFLSDARLLSPQQRQTVEAAIAALEGHAHG